MTDRVRQQREQPEIHMPVGGDELPLHDGQNRARVLDTILRSPSPNATQNP